MSVTQDRARTSGEQTFDSLSPATGEVVATFPVHGEAEVREAVQRARKASQWWQSLGPDGRKQRLGYINHRHLPRLGGRRGKPVRAARNRPRSQVVEPTTPSSR